MTFLCFHKMVVTKNSIQENMNPILVILPLYQVILVINPWGKWGKLKKCMPVAVPSLSWNILEHPKAAHYLTLPVPFVLKQKKGVMYPFHFLHIFPWLNIVEKNLPWNILLAQLKITVINVASQLKPRFRVTLVLCNSISRKAYC